MAKYTIYLDCPMFNHVDQIMLIYYRDKLDTLFVDGNYYLLYRDVLEQEIEHHILRLTDLGYKVLFIKPVEE
jgi:hypothetical protein